MNPVRAGSIWIIIIIQQLSNCHPIPELIAYRIAHIGEIPNTIPETYQRRTYTQRTHNSTITQTASQLLTTLDNIILTNTQLTQSITQSILHTAISGFVKRLPYHAIKVIHNTMQTSQTLPANITYEILVIIKPITITLLMVSLYNTLLINTRCKLVS